MAAFFFKHPESHCARLKESAGKSMIEELRYDIETLKKKEAQREQILLDWEIRSRIAQGLNDVLIKDVPENVLTRLKYERCGYLPSLLSNWAAHQRITIPALDLISDNDFLTYSMRGDLIQDKGLENDVTSVWNLIPQDKRLLLISMWVSRPELCWGVMSHSPTPTIDQAERLVEADPNLGPREVSCAKEVIRTAVDKCYVPLFRNADSESRMD